MAESRTDQEMLEDLMYEVELETIFGKTAQMLREWSTRVKVERRPLTTNQSSVLRKIWNEHFG